MPNESIYDGPRLAQPDEVANYKTGDGVEKAFTLANILRSKDPQRSLELIIDGASVILRGQKEYSFNSSKGLKKHIEISPRGVNVK